MTTVVDVMHPSGVAFETSRARGEEKAMTGWVCYADTAGFLSCLAKAGAFRPGDAVALAGDLRPRKPRILVAPEPVAEQVAGLPGGFTFSDRLAPFPPPVASVPLPAQLLADGRAQQLALQIGQFGDVSCDTLDIDLGDGVRALCQQHDHPFTGIRQCTRAAALHRAGQRGGRRRAEGVSDMRGLVRGAANGRLATGRVQR